MLSVRETHRSVASRTPLPGDLAHSPGMCPDWASSWRPLSLQAGAESTEPRQPGLDFYSDNFLVLFKWMFLSNVHPCPLLKANCFSTHNASDTKCVNFPHQVILQFPDPTCVSDDLLQF